MEILFIGVKKREIFGNLLDIYSYLGLYKGVRIFLCRFG